MRTKKETIEFLESLQWERMTKKELANKFTDFFGKEMTLNDSTDPDCKDLDYALITTTGEGCCAEHFIDMEIYYLKMRNREILITGTELLDYVE